MKHTVSFLAQLTAKIGFMPMSQLLTCFSQ
jgi:hypothetical protein